MRQQSSRGRTRRDRKGILLWSVGKGREEPGQLSSLWLLVSSRGPRPGSVRRCSTQLGDLTVHAGTCSSRDPECNVSGSSWTGKDLNRGHEVRERRVHESCSLLEAETNSFSL